MEECSFALSQLRAACGAARCWTSWTGSDLFVLDMKYDDFYISAPNLFKKMILIHISFSPGDDDGSDR